MNELTKVFQYDGAQVRTVIKDGEPWFVAKDVCEVLDIGNVGQALSRLDSDEKADITLNDGRQNRMFGIINEPGLYTLILGSRKPEAKEFKRWVTHEVLPSIRKTGSYGMPQLSPAEVLAGVANQLVEQERKLAAIESRMDRTEKQQEDINTILALNPTEWRKKVSNLLNKIAYQLGGQYQAIRNESYELLEDRAKCRLSVRVENIKRRMALEGVSRSKIASINNMDAIAEDARLTEIYLAIVKEMAVRHRIEVSEL